VPIPAVAAPNARWSLDFVYDRPADGRRPRILNVVDDTTKQCLAAVVEALDAATDAADMLAAWAQRRFDGSHLPSASPAVREPLSTDRAAKKGVVSKGFAGAAGDGDAPLRRPRVLSLACFSGSW
jgi:transposase InsO family protein